MSFLSDSILFHSLFDSLVVANFAVVGVVVISFDVVGVVVVSFDVVSVVDEGNKPDGTDCTIE